MELEFSHVFDASAQDLWSVLLNPDRVGACVPGMQSVTVVSDTEYSARIRVKIAFISAHFDLRTVITEAQPPTFLRAEASGEDGKIGSSVKARVEMRLTPLASGRTELRVVAQADVLGRLGTLGLSPMRTKAEGMWAQFCAALAAVLAGGEGAQGAPTAPASPAAKRSAGPAAQAAAAGPRWSRWFGRHAPAEFRIEIERAGARVVITCPPAQADQCLAWLDRQLKAPPA